MTPFDLGWEVFGWIGSILVVASLAQAKVMRLHVLNLIASAMLIAYNGVLGVAPGVGLNLALFAVNLWRLTVIIRARRAAPVEGVPHVD